MYFVVYGVAQKEKTPPWEAENNGKSDPQSTYTEWQLPLSDVHSIMMEKLAQAGEGGGCTPIAFYYTYRHVQSCGVRSS